MGTMRGNKPQAHSLWLQHHSTLMPLFLEGCRTVALLVIAGIVGLLLVKLVPAETPSVSSASASASNSDSASYSNYAGVLVDGVGHVVTLDGNPKTPNRFDLGAVIFNRVFQSDLFNITAFECRQWIEFMLYAGVEHIYWYDTAHSDAESQESYLRDYVHRGLLTYHRFHDLYPGHLDADFHFEQDHSYEHFLESHRNSVNWVVEMDVDEYPFMVTDTKRLFLIRYVEYLERSRPDVTQILLPCMIFGGQPQGPSEDGWVIERYQRRKRVTEGTRAGFSSRTKPIFQANFARGVSSYDPHQFPMKSGNTFVTSPEVLRMNHYWGPRLSDFKPDTAAVLALLMPDASAQEIADKLKVTTGLTSKAGTLAKLQRQSA